MKKQKLMASVLVGALVLCVVFMSGCTRGRQEGTQTTTTQPLRTTTTQPPQKTSGLETCAELHGYECEVGEGCEGEWLDAADTFSCCSEECNEGVLTLEPFDVGPENEELGDVI